VYLFGVTVFRLIRTMRLI